MLLSRESILAAEDLIFEEVDVPEWGGKVRVRTLLGSERDDFEQSMVKQARGKEASVNIRNIRAKLVALTVVDAEGKRLFTKREDVDALGRKSAAALDRVFDVAQRLAGLRPEDVEELAKNSEEGQSEDSILD